MSTELNSPYGLFVRSTEQYDIGPGCFFDVEKGKREYYHLTSIVPSAVHEAFVHVSTAFSHCSDREVIEERLYESPISANNLMLLVDALDEKTIERITPSLLGTYPNTYVFTKAIAEDICRIKGSNLPITIFRPAIVISSAKEPIPGWINNVYGPTGVVAAAAVGLLKTLHSDKNCKANVVPCDYVVNAAIASAWSVGTESTNQNNILAANKVVPNGFPVTEKPNGSIPKENRNGSIPNGNLKGSVPKENLNESLPNGNVTHSATVTASTEANLQETKKIPIYNYSCDLLEKPFTWKEFMELNERQEPKMPSSMTIWAYSLTLVKNKKLYQLYCILLHLFPAFLFDTVARLIGKEPKLMDAYQRLHKLADVLGYFSTREWKMTHDNVSVLWSRLSKKDKELFDFDMNSLDWTHFYYIHCTGIRRFILKEHPDTIPAAKKRRTMLLFLHYFLMSTLTSVSLYLLFSLIRRIVS